MRFQLMFDLELVMRCNVIFGHADHGDAQILEFLAMVREVQRFFGATGRIVLWIKVEDEWRPFRPERVTLPAPSVASLNRGRLSPGFKSIPFPKKLRSNVWPYRR